MIQAILVGVGGTIETFFTGYRPPTCAMNLFDSTGAALVTGGICAPDSVNTTTSVANVLGDRTVTLTSATGVTSRRRYLLGDEEVTVRSVAGSVATLCAPLERNHASGSAFQGLRVTFVVTSLVAAVENLNLRAVFVPETGEPQAEVCEFAKNKVPIDLISEVDVRGVIPKSVMAESSERDVLTAFRDARNNMVMDMGGKHRAHASLGIDHLRRMCAHRFWLDLRTEIGSEWSPIIDKVEEEYKRLLQLVDSQAPTVGSDGKTTAGPNDGAFMDFDLGAC